MNYLFLFAGEYNTVRAKNCEGQDHDDFVSRNGECQGELGAVHIGEINTLRTGSFKLFKRPFPGFLTILTL